MNANKCTILILTLLSMGTIACSSIENKLVGEWQSTQPDSVHLTIARDPSSPGRFNQNNDGFYRGFKWTEDGDIYNYWWRIEDGDQGAILDIATNDNFPVRGYLPHKIIELTSDKFVVEWGLNDKKRVVEFHRVFTGSTDIKEFQRVNVAEERAAEERAIEERRKMLAAAPTLLVGSWRDENSLITYGADGTISGKYDNGSTTKGTWSVDGDILTDVVVEVNGKRLENPQSQRYQILDLSGEKLVSKSVSGGKEWHAVRVK